MVVTMVDPPRHDEEPVQAAWDRLLETWDDRGAHRKFVALCASLGRLGDAGKRYRAVRDDDPEPARRDEARAQIDRLFGVAMQSLEALKTPPRTRPPTWLYIAAGLLLTALVSGSILWLLAASRTTVHP
jgi:hypothetical protein